MNLELMMYAEIFYFVFAVLPPSHILTFLHMNTSKKTFNDLFYLKFPDILS